MPSKRNLDDLSDVYPKTDLRLTKHILDLMNCFVEFYVAKYNGSHLSDYMKFGYNGFKPYVDLIGIKTEARLTDLVLDSDQYCRSLRLKSENSDWIKTSGLQTKEIYFAFAVNLFGDRDVDANSC